MSAPYTGGCLCGAVSFTIEAEPLFTGTCWCRDCQRIAGGSAVTAALFPKDAVALSGEVAGIRKAGNSGNEIERCFCPLCGTHVFGRTTDADEVIRIRVGALDNPDDFAPQVVIWTDSAPKWAVIDPKLPQFPKSPPTPGTST